MSKKKSVKINLAAAVIICSITAVFFTANYAKTKKSMTEFNAALKKNETPAFTEVAQTLLNDNKFGTLEENVRYANSGSGKGLIEIKEKMFLAQTNDVYLNTKDYLGKTIKLEGLFKQQQSTERAAPYCFVIRYGPGCCGYDGSAGFEVAWENRQAGQYPGIDAWVEAMGILKEYKEDDQPFLYISLTQLNVLDKKGAEFVSQ